MRKSIALLLLAALVLIAARARAVEIPIEARHHNVANYCTWSALDTLARTHGIASLVGITRQRWDSFKGRFSDPGLDAEVRKELTARGVEFQMRDHGSYDRALLENFTASHGVVIGWKTGTPTMGCHSVVVTEYDQQPDGSVRYYDPSKPLQNGQPKIWTVPRSFFDQWWMGGSIVVFSNSQAQPASGSLSKNQPAAPVATKPASVLVQLNTPYVP
jgi:hypothetical protein